MKKHIAEDLPSRPHPQASLSAQSKGDKDRGGSSNSDEDSSPDKRIRQAVYDIKYRARRENIPLRSAYSQYMQNSSMSEMEKSEVRKRLFGDVGGGGGEKPKKFVKAFKKPGMQAEDFQVEMKNFASLSMANALYKVFVEKKTEPVDIDELKIELEEKTHFNAHNNGVKKFKVRVYDPKSDVSYVRYATREKINELRAKGLKVEFTEYGTPYEGEREKGEQTSKALGGGKKGKKPNDGNLANNYPPYDKVTKGDVVAGRLGKDQMGGKNVKENFFLDEVLATANLPQMDSPEYVNPNANPEQIDVATKKNKIVVNPPENKGTTASHSYNSALFAHNELEGDVILENGYSKFLKLLQEKKMTAAKKKKEKKLKKKYDKSGMKASMQNQYGKEKGKKVYFATIRKQAMKEESDCGCEDTKEKEEKLKCADDKRSLPTTISLAKSKFQSMGAKNPLVMMATSYEPEGEMVDEATASAKRGVPETHRGDVEGRRSRAGESLSAAKTGKTRRLEGAERLALSGHPENAQSLLTGKSKEEKEHAKKFPGSKQKPKAKGAKETPKERHTRIVNRHNERVIKHGFTTREKEESKAREPYDSAND